VATGAYSKPVLRKTKLKIKILIVTSGLLPKALADYPPVTSITNAYSVAAQMPFLKASPEEDIFFRCSAGF
jgi:hypothetical protein